MDEQSIKELYFDDGTLTNGAAPKIEAGDTVIAGQDDRKDIHELEDDAQGDLQRKLTASTVILTDKSDLTKNGNGTWTLSTTAFRQQENEFKPVLPPCSGEKFANQQIGGWCSGFLVGPDIIVTAGHCGGTESKIKNTAYVFGFQASSTTDPGRQVFDDNQVYFGKELLAFDLSTSGDFAIVRVDRAVTSPGAEALTIRTSGTPSVGTNLGVIGYPSGLPVKIAFGENTVLMRDEDPWLIANLDTYGGNSGSPVFGKDGTVEGILVRGATDYLFENSCFKSNKVQNSADSEAVTKASVFVDKIPT